MCRVTWLTVAGAVTLVVGLVGPVWASEQGHGGRHGHGGHHGGHGHHGGGHGGKGGPSVSAPAAVSAPSGGESAGAWTQGYSHDLTGPQGSGAPIGLLTASQARTEADTQQALAEAGHVGLVQVERIQANGAFTYSGYEWAMVAFAQAMQRRGYEMGVMGQPSTNFGSPVMMEQIGG